jgi:hypothetical protein
MPTPLSDIPQDQARSESFQKMILDLGRSFDGHLEAFMTTLWDEGRAQFASHLSNLCTRLVGVHACFASDAHVCLGEPVCMRSTCSSALLYSPGPHVLIGRGALTHVVERLPQDFNGHFSQKFGKGHDLLDDSLAM